MTTKFQAHVETTMGGVTVHPGDFIEANLRPDGLYSVTVNGQAIHYAETGDYLNYVAGQRLFGKETKDEAK